MAAGEAFISWLTREKVELKRRVAELTDLSNSAFLRATTLEQTNTMLKAMLADEKAERIRLTNLVISNGDKATERKEELESLVYTRVGLVQREVAPAPTQPITRSHVNPRAQLARLEADRKKQYWEQEAAKVGPIGGTDVTSKPEVEQDDHAILADSGD